MAIGTTVKVGYDGRAVEKGLGRLKTGFMGLGRVIGGKLGLGGVTKAVGAITALGLGYKAISGFKEMADYAGGLTDMATQTGVAISKLVELEEALRVAGVPAADTSRILSRLAGSLQEAQMESGPARDALHGLGFLASEFKDMKLDEAFMLIGKRIAELGPEAKNLESTMEDLFGARIGYGLLRLFNDPSNFAAARRNVALLGQEFEKYGPELDAMSDDLGGLAVQLRGFYLGLYKAMKPMFGEKPLQGLFDAFRFENANAFFEKIKNTLLLIKQEGIGKVLGDAFADLGERLKNIIMEGVSEGIRAGLPGGGTLKGILGFGGRETATTDVSKIEDNTAQTVGMLRRIAREGGTAKFA